MRKEKGGREGDGGGGVCPSVSSNLVVLFHQGSCREGRVGREEGVECS